MIDVVRDQLHGADYVREEDPRIFHSSKTGRGPLKETWIEDFENECKVSFTKKDIVCALFDLEGSKLKIHWRFGVFAVAYTGKEIITVWKCDHVCLQIMPS